MPQYIDEKSRQRLAERRFISVRAYQYPYPDFGCDLERSYPNVKVSDGLSRAGAKIMLSDFDAVAFTPLSDTYWPSPSLSLQNILWSQVEVWNWGRNVLALQGTQRM